MSQRVDTEKAPVSATTLLGSASGNARDLPARIDPVLVRRCHRAAEACGILAVLFASLTLLGWAIDAPGLRSIIPGAVSMNPATALGFLLGGGALVLFPGRGRRSTVVALASLAALVGALKLLALAGGPDAGIDRWLFGSRLADDPGEFLNRMAPNTAASLVQVGTAIALLRLRRARTVAQALAFVVVALALVALTGYAYGLDRLYGLPQSIPMAPNTAAGFLALSVGALLADPVHGFVRYFATEGAGGILARRLLPAAIFVPLSAGWARVLGERAGWYAAEFGIALMVVFSAAILVLVVGWTASLLDRFDARRMAAEWERARLNEALETRLDELALVNRELESFTYAVSHDLRSPLRSISGFAQALEEDRGDVLDAIGIDYLGRIRAAAGRMSDLIDGLLDLSRVTRAKIEPEPVDLSRRAIRAVEDLREAEPDRKVELRIEEDLAARGDARLLDVVVSNLLANAWKYTRDEPVARIEFGRLPGEESPGPFFVRDNGAGFDMEFSDRLFGAFQRLHGVDEFEGTGIGLATVQRIVHRHGGRVWAEAEVGRGATFYFTLHERRKSR